MLHTLGPMTSDEIRETFLAFFEQRDHRRAALGFAGPAAYDPSVLLTTAGMQPLKPYFLGHEQPPHNRLTTCQKCFRTTDIENVGKTRAPPDVLRDARQLLDRRLLQGRGGRVRAGSCRRRGSGSTPTQIWITVFAGDDELGLGPDEEAIAAVARLGVPRERIVRLPRARTSGRPARPGPCGPCSRAVPRPGTGVRRPRRPARATTPSASSSTGTSSSWPYDQHPDGSLTAAAVAEHRHRLGLERMAAIQQDVSSVFETDQFAP